MSHEDNKVIGFKDPIKLTSITRNELQEEYFISPRYSCIHISIKENEVVDTYNVEETIANGLVVIKNKSIKDSDEFWDADFDTAEEAWKESIKLLKLKFNILKQKFNSRKLGEAALNFISGGKNKKYTKELFLERKDNIEKSIQLLNNELALEAYFEKEMKKLNSEDYMKEKLKVVNSPLCIGDSIYILHLGNLLNRRLNGSAFSLEEYIIDKKDIRKSYARKEDGDKDWVDMELTFSASPKMRKKNVPYYDVSFYFGKDQKGLEPLSLYVRSYYLEAFKTKEDALQYVRGFKEETENFINSVAEL